MTYFVYLAHALNCNTKTNGTKVGLLLKTVDTGYAAHTAQPVLSKPCIKQAPVLSKQFHFPPIDFTCK